MRGQTGRPFPHSMFDDSAPFATAFFYKYGQQATTAPQFFWDGTTVAARQHEGRGKEGERTEGSGGESGTHFADGGRGRGRGRLVCRTDNGHDSALRGTFSLSSPSQSFSTLSGAAAKNGRGLRRR